VVKNPRGVQSERSTQDQAGDDVAEPVVAEVDPSESEEKGNDDADGGSDPTEWPTSRPEQSGHEGAKKALRIAWPLGKEPWRTGSPEIRTRR